MSSQNRKGKNLKIADPSKPKRDFDKAFKTSKAEMYKSGRKIKFG